MTDTVAENDNIELENLVEDNTRNKTAQQSVTETPSRPALICQYPCRIAILLFLLIFGVSYCDVLLQRKNKATLSNLTQNDDNTVEFVVNGTVYKLSKRAATQVQHYKQGTGLLLHIHVTHHAGTTFCAVVGHSPYVEKPAPPFACRIDRPNENAKRNVSTVGIPTHDPWNYNATARNIPILRNWWHMVTWEHGNGDVPRPALKRTNWEHDDLVSIMLMRDPISRLLAGDGWTASHYKLIRHDPYHNATRDYWMEYANTHQTDNFCLNVLAGKECCQGEDTDPRFLEAAKELVKRFTFVLDVECLDESMLVLADILGIRVDLKRRQLLHDNELQRNLARHNLHPPNSERIPYKDVYDYLLRRNKLDIELYEWSKTISLVNCAALRQQGRQ